MTSSHIPSCCLKAFRWDGTPTGTESTLPSTPNNPFYVAGDNPSAAILIIHDLFGWYVSWEESSYTPKPHITPYPAALAWKCSLALTKVCH
jgi:hypothetical protein